MDLRANELQIGRAFIGRAHVELGLGGSDAHRGAFTFDRNVVPRGDDRHGNHHLFEETCLAQLRVDLGLGERLHRVAIERPKADAGRQENTGSRFEARIDVERTGASLFVLLFHFSEDRGFALRVLGGDFLGRVPIDERGGHYFPLRTVEIVIAHAVALDVVFAHQLKAAIFQHELDPARRHRRGHRRRLILLRGCRRGVRRVLR